MKRDISLGDRKVTIVGTSHVSKDSREEVEAAIDAADPDLVAVELDKARLKALRGDDGWKDMDVAEAVRNGKGYMLFMNLVLAIYQRSIGLDKGITPGQEMLAAADIADQRGIELALIDRDINDTFRRAVEELTIWEKLKLLASLMATTEDVEPDELLDGDIIDNLVLELEEEYPSLSKTFLDERNSYMAEKLREHDFDHAVAVVGAAHMEGIINDLKQENRYDVVKNTGFPWMTAVKYGIPGFIILGLGYSFLKLGFSTGIEASAAWILINGVLAGIGAIAARSHPLTWITSFLAAPLTSLDPAIGAGMVAAYAEAKIRPPKVKDLESVSELENYRELWSNQVGIILLTFVLVSLGSAAATFISAGYIASLISGI